MIVDAPDQVAGVSNVHHNVEKKGFYYCVSKKEPSKSDK